jgi:hypothetical protein
MCNHYWKWSHQASSEQDRLVVPLLNHNEPPSPSIPVEPNALRLDNDPAQRDVQNIPFGCSFDQVYTGLFRGHGKTHLRSGEKVKERPRLNGQHALPNLPQ